MSRNLVLSIAFVAVFSLILIIALLAEISLRVGFERALLAAVVFTALLWVVMQIVKYYAPPEEAGPTLDHLGQHLNLEVNDIPAEDQDGQAGSMNDAAFSEQGFTPLAGRQVDPDMARVINQDPKKLAKIVEKMGFDE